MSVWKIMRAAVAAALSLGLFMWPCDSAAARRKKSDRAARKKASQRQRDKKPAPQVSEKSAPLSPEQVLSALISNARNAENLSEKNREILVEALTVMAKTPRGRWILSNVSPKVRFAVLPDDDPTMGLGRFSHGNLTLFLDKKFFNDFSKAGPPHKRQEDLYFLIITLAHELTHAVQNNRSICHMDGASSSDCVLMIKLRELHARLEDTVIRDQMLDLPDFRDLRKRPRYSTTLLRRKREEKIREGLSPEAADRAVRTEFMKAYWRAAPSDPVRIGNDLIFLYGIDRWHHIYNKNAFRNVLGGGPNHYRDRGKSIDEELRRGVSFMEVDVSPSFFQKEKQFTFERGRFTTYLDGFKNEEWDSLTVGHVVKTYFDGKLQGVKVTVTRAENGSFTDYWYGTKRPRAEYTIKDKKPVGVYKEYDYSGQQVAEIPFSDGAANGMGWVVEGGKEVEYLFKKGWCDCTKRATRSPWNRKEEFWRERYLKKQRSGAR